MVLLVKVRILALQPSAAVMRHSYIVVILTEQDDLAIYLLAIARSDAPSSYDSVGYQQPRLGIHVEFLKTAFVTAGEAVFLQDSY